MDILVEYPRIVKALKEAGTSVEDMPDDVAASLLALHQEWTQVWWERVGRPRMMANRARDRQRRLDKWKQLEEQRKQPQP